MSFSKKADQVLRKARNEPSIGRLIMASDVPRRPLATSAVRELCQKIPPGMALGLTEAEVQRLGISKAKNVSSAISYLRKIKVVSKYFRVYMHRNLGEDSIVVYIVNDEPRESRIKEEPSP